MCLVLILEIMPKAISNCIRVDPLITKRVRHLNEHIIYNNLSFIYWAKFLKLIKYITQSYLSLLNSILLLVLSTLSVFLKSLSDYFFIWPAYKSLLIVNKLYCLMWSSNLFPASSCFPFFMVRVFLGPGPGLGSGSRF